MKKDEIKDELEELSPFLASLNKDKKAGMAMPANYFERFEDRLMHRIQEEEALSPKASTEKPKRVGLWDFFRSLWGPRYVGAFSMAVVALVFTVYWLDNGSIEEVNAPILVAELTQMETEAYIINNIDDFATEDIVEVAENDVVETIEVSIEPIVKEVEVVDNEPVEESQNIMDKALKKAGAEDLLEDLTEEDLEDDIDDLF